MTTLSIKENYQDPAVAERYDQQRFHGLAGKAFDILERRAIRRVLVPIRRAASLTPVLDAPCGTGRITGLLLQLGLHVVGGDVSEAMLAVAQRRHARYGQALTLRRLDLEHVDLPDNSFELVTCIRLFHHLDSPARAAILRELARVSRCFVLVNVSYASPYYRLRRRLKRALGQGVSRQASTAAQIDDEARHAGLKLISRRFVLPGISEDLLLLLQKRQQKTAGRECAS